MKNAGSLFVHKATHHFDLLNWYVGADPEVVSAFGELRNMIFKDGADPLGQRAGSRAGAMSVKVGLAALESAQQGRTVRIAEFGEI